MFEELNLHHSVGVLYADPPWKYNNKRTGGSMKSGAGQKYNTMSNEEIGAMALDIDDVVLPDSVLFLWATTPLKNEALAVMDLWGYTYKTTVYWLKTGRLGMGFWFRGCVEELLVGVRGKVKPFRRQICNYLMLPPRAHSEKPEEFRMLINSATKNVAGDRLELFARRAVMGWLAWGDEIDWGE